MSKFINETTHPKAESLLNHILLCASRKDNGNAWFYHPLQFWGEAQGVSDEQLYDLYARLEESYPRGGFFAIPDAQRINAISKALWANDKEFL